MKSNRCISVVIPTYNRAEFLAEAIDSVLDQDYGDYSLDLIVVDDGSTDNTENIIHNYKDKLRYIKLPHSGLPSVARNHGISVARGDIIAFQDSDDAWPKDKIKNQIKMFDDSSIHMSYGQAYYMNNDGTKTKEVVVPEKDLNNGENFNDLLKTNGISTLTVMVRKDSLNIVGGFNESDSLRAVEDYELWLRILARFPKGVKKVNKPLAYYRRHANNISHADNHLAMSRLLSVYDSIWKLDYLTSAQRQDLEDAITEMQNNFSNVLNDKYGQPFVSVILSVYNAEKYLKLAIDSLLKQTLKNIEIIVIDDGSNDGSGNILNAYLQDNRFRLVRQTNHGLVYSLNKGVTMARSEYVARMDADDISLPSRLEIEYEHMVRKENIGLVSGYFAYIDEATSLPTGTIITAPTKSIDLRRSLYISNPFAHGCTMFRKAAFKDAGGYRNDYGPTEDYDLWRRIPDKWELEQIPEVLYFYRLNPSGISHQKQDIQHAYTFKIQTELWKQDFAYKGYRSIINDAEYYKSFNDNYSEQVYKQYVSHQYLLAREMLLRAWIKRGFVTALATWRLDKRKRASLIRLMIVSILRKLHIKSRTTSLQKGDVV